MNPTLDEFLTWKFPFVSYIEHPDFSDLYVRSSYIHVIMDDEVWRCEPVLQIGNIKAKDPGQGAFTAFVEHVVALDRAIYVECVHNERFQRKLLEMGFVEVNKDGGALHYLFNFEGRLQKPEPLI